LLLLSVFLLFKALQELWWDRVIFIVGKEWLDGKAAGGVLVLMLA
jgi:hypothetical protein